MPRLAFALCCLALLGGIASAQGGPHGHDAPTPQRHAERAEGKDEGHAATQRTGRDEAEAPIHRPQMRLSGDEAFAFVQARHEQTKREHPDSGQPGEKSGHETPTRPAGSGRYVCAVVACADAGIDACALLGLDAKDVLLIQNAGANADADVAELVARAQQDHGLSLVVVLAHDACGSLGEGARARRGAGASASPESTRIEQRASAARALADRLRISIAHAHALRQRERLEAALRDRPAAHASCEGGDETPMAPVRVVAATVDAAERRVTWRTQRQDSLPIAPVR